MTYKMECVLTEVVLGKEILYSFEPVSKYQLKINGTTIYVAVALDDVSGPKVIAVPGSKLRECKLKEKCNVEAVVMMKSMTATLLFDESGNLLAFE